MAIGVWRWAPFPAAVLSDVACLEAAAVATEEEPNSGETTAEVAEGRPVEAAHRVAIVEVVAVHPPEPVVSINMVGATLNTQNKQQRKDIEI